MRWRKPKRGDKRVRKAFLWIPKTIAGETRFWETATWEDEFALSYHGLRLRIGDQTYFASWKAVRWLE